MSGGTELVDDLRPWVERAGYELRGFHAGHARFPLSNREEKLIAEMRGKLACVLADCGFAEAASECRREPAAHKAEGALDVDAVVQSVMRVLTP
jgi:hypothetical protein